jgi:hypothetical protein
MYICVYVLIYDPVIFSAFRDQHRSEIFVGHLVRTVNCVWCRASCSKYHALPFGVVIRHTVADMVPKINNRPGGQLGHTASPTRGFGFLFYHTVTVSELF